RMDDAKRYGHEAIALLADPAYEPFVWAYTDLVMIALFEGDEAAAVEFAKAAAAHPADAPDRFGAAILLLILAQTGQSEQALRIAGGILAQVTATGGPTSIAIAQHAIGLALAKSDPQKAIAMLERALITAQDSGNLFWVSFVVAAIANLQAKAGEP